ncbi:MAG: hypothetical protein KGI08_09785 [Thaumarchaeota archaeon]|nr:hypothetical protein [Nitrososphaerota archaeon]
MQESISQNKVNIIAAEVVIEEIKELRENLKTIEPLLGKESSTYQKRERKLNKLLKQAKAMGIVI